MTVEKGRIKEIKAIDGDMRLGGNDFDNAMVEFAIREIENFTGEKIDKANIRVRARIQDACK